MAAAERRTLLIDMDPQCNATTGAGVEKALQRDVPRGILGLLAREHDRGETDGGAGVRRLLRRLEQIERRVEARRGEFHAGPRGVALRPGEILLRRAKAGAAERIGRRHGAGGAGLGRRGKEIVEGAAGGGRRYIVHRPGNPVGPEVQRGPGAAEAVAEARLEHPVEAQDASAIRRRESSASLSRSTAARSNMA